ncbi:MAG TPA: ATP synthase F1 subunit epsilon [Solirubrobacteraceae bacterium]|jgi:F-type H+-transporting ATPase subunit epsilon|nr:ATP synthase F1 subunit epsilon [Solirubrobacteraceae bacterium]
MAHSKFQVEVLTPEGEVFKDEVEMVSTFTAEGSIGVLANHAPILAILEPTELRLYRSEGDIVHFAQAEGYMQVGHNHVLVLVEEAYEPSALNVEELRERLSGAEHEVEQSEEDSERRRAAERAQRRIEVFLEIASSSG